MIKQSRRGFITGISAIIASPAIVRASSLMPVKPLGASGLPWSIVSDDQIVADITMLMDRLLKQSNALYLATYFPSAAPPGQVTIPYRPLNLRVPMILR